MWRFHLGDWGSALYEAAAPFMSNTGVAITDLEAMRQAIDEGRSAEADGDNSALKDETMSRGNNRVIRNDHHTACSDVIAMRDVAMHLDIYGLAPPFARSLSRSNHASYAPTPSSTPASVASTSRR